MRIEVIRQDFDNEYSYKYLPLRFCCHELEDDYSIGFYYESPTSGNDLRDDDNKRMPQMMIFSEETWTEWGEDFSNQFYHPIKFCPFCGKPIEIMLIKKEDLSEIYADLKNKRDNAAVACRKTDSKQKEQELRNLMYELDDKINYLYELGEYNNEILHS